MPAYLILQRNPLEGAATSEDLIRDLNDYGVRFRGEVFRSGADARAQRTSLIAISSKGMGHQDIEARLQELAEGYDADENPDVPMDGKSRAWYRNVRLRLPDEQLENTILAGIAKDILSAELRGKP